MLGVSWCRTGGSLNDHDSSKHPGLDFHVKFPKNYRILILFLQLLVCRLLIFILHIVNDFGANYIL